MFNPTDETKKDPLSSQPKLPITGLGQNQVPIIEKKENSQTSSNLFNALQNTQPSKEVPIPKPKVESINKEEKEAKFKENENLGPIRQGTGGVLKSGGKQDEKKESLAIDTTLHFGLKEIIDGITNKKNLDGRQLDKIIKNFINYVKTDAKPFSLDKITSIDEKIPNKPKILNLPYLNQIEEKSKITINYFWVEMIEGICEKIPFLSESACLEIVKLEISMNKNIYCQKGNLGNFSVELFAKPLLFPIVNNKIQVNTHHELYISIENEIISLVLNLFKALQCIFSEMTILKINQTSEYNKIFLNLDENTEKKKEILKNLLESFFSILKLTPEEKFTSNIQYLQSIAHSIWNFYQANKDIFEPKICKNFLHKLNQNYTFFNHTGKHKSSNLNKFINSIEKITISFLLTSPFNYNDWENHSLKTTILESNLEMLEPFKMIFPKNRRQERKIRVSNYETKAMHWKTFIEIMIKLEEDDDETIEFIIECMRSFLGENFKTFWERPSEFESFYRFTRRLLNQKSNEFNEEEMRDRFLEILGIGSKLMGCKKSESDENAYIMDIEEEYPENKVVPYSLVVYNEFSQYFLGMNKKEFEEVINGEVLRMIEDIIENGTDKYDTDHEANLRREYLLKEYLLKLISSEPNLFFSIFSTDSGIKHENFLDFLIFTTITNSSLPSNIIDFAFVALDRMLIDPNTSKLIYNILSLDGIEIEVSRSVNLFFENKKALPFIARHCGLLIDLNYEKEQWTRELLKKFYEFSLEEGSRLFDINSIFAKSYYQLFSGIFSRLHSRDVKSIVSLRPYINISFIIDSLKYYLKFDLYRGEYVNIAVYEQNPKKIESLMECLRLYNIILIYQLKIHSINLEGNSLIDSTNMTSKENVFLTPFEAKELGIEDNEFSLQVRSLKNETTSYLNALSFILVSSTHEQKKLLKEINYDYESLILETIETLAKLNGKINLKSQFEVTNPSKPTLEQTKTQLREYGWCLKKIVSYVESSLNESGIELVLFGGLIEKPERLRNLIDKVREKIENPKIRDRMSSKLSLKIISTLSRYFRECMGGMSFQNDKQNSFESLEIRDHFEYLVQTIIEFIVGLKGNSRNWQQNMIGDILSNIYGGFIRVQRFNSYQFLKLLKNFHPILLNSINLSYMERGSFINDRFEFDFKKEFDNKGSQPMIFNEEYFKLLELFFNCEQYLSEKEFNIIRGIKELPVRLETFILGIAKYTEFSKLPEDFINILLEILLSGLSFYLTISNSQQEKLAFLSEFYDLVLSRKHQLKPSLNSTLLELLVFNELSISYNYKDLTLQNQEILPLQLISFVEEIPPEIMEQIISKLKKPNLTNMAFLSIANGLFSNIEHSPNPTYLLQPLLQIYNQLLKNPQTNSLSFSNPLLHSTSLTNQSNQIFKEKNYCNSPYQKIWILELILNILTNIQANPNPEKKQNEKEFENLLIQNDSILRRFGIILKKIAFQESETYLPWLSFLEEEISYELSNNLQVTFVEKLELYQIMKIFSFLFANTNWQESFLNKHVELISVLVQYRKVFEKLCFSSKKQKGETVQEKILEGISLENLLSTQGLISSGLNKYEREWISGEVLKSSNSFELLHEIMNFDLSLQFSLMWSSIGIPFCDGLSRKSPEIADVSKWNSLFLELTQALVQKYIQLLNQESFLEKILNEFSEIYNGNSQYNISLSKEMLFTNSPSLSSCLDVSYKSWKEILIETLSLLFENIYTINRKLQTELHSEFKNQQERFNNIILLLKKHDKENFDFGLYDASEQKNKMNQTIRSNFSRNQFNSQINPFSASIRNY